MLINENNTMPYMKSLATCLNKIVADGYRETFKITDAGLQSLSGEVVYQPEEITVVNFFRFEGSSDPDDNAILYVIETSDGKKGTLVDAYGIYNDARTSAFIKEVHEFHKKVIKEHR
jgi:hypothetical protein